MVPTPPFSLLVGALTMGLYEERKVKHFIHREAPSAPEDKKALGAALEIAEWVAEN